MKKTLAILLIMILAFSCVMLSGCGGSSDSTPPADSQYIGTWGPTKAIFKGEETDINEVLEESEYFTITLNADGSAVLVSSEETTEGNWSETKEGFKIKGDDLNMKFKNEDGVISFSLLGVDLVFEKME